MNSNFQELPSIKARDPYNPAWICGADMTALGVSDGDRIEIRSAHGRIHAIVKRDDTMRPGVVSMTHAWGQAVAEGANTEDGALTNLLISDTDAVEIINAMPAFSAIPVRLRALHPAA